MYASSPRDKNGGGTSNINISESWSARIPALFCSRTALAHLSMSARISISSLDKDSCSPLSVMLSPFAIERASADFSGDQRNIRLDGFTGGDTALILVTNSLDVRFAVRIEEFFAALLPGCSEFGRRDVPVGPTFFRNGA